MTKSWIATLVLSFTITISVKAGAVERICEQPSLVKAIVNQNLKKIERELRKGSEPNSFCTYEHFGEQEKESILEMIFRLPMDFKYKEENHQNLIKITKLLLSYGASPDLAASRGNTPLMQMMRMLVEARTQCGSKTWQLYLDLVQQMIKKSKNLNEQDEKGSTALAIAAASGADFSVKMLLDAGANPDIIDENGESAIFHTNRIFAKLLIENGIDPNIQDTRYGWTAFMKVISNHQDLDLINLFLASSVKPDLSIVNKNGEAALHFILGQYSDTELAIEAILKAGANVNQQNALTGDTPLMGAVKSTRFSNWTYHCRALEKVKLFIKYGADRTIENFKTLTPLEFALENKFGADHDSYYQCQWAEKKILELLLEH